MAAFRLARDERLLAIQPAAPPLDGYQIRTLRADHPPGRRILFAPSPVWFLATHPTEQGEVRVSPPVDAMLRRLRLQREQRERASRSDVAQKEGPGQAPPELPHAMAAAAASKDALTREAVRPSQAADSEVPSPRGEDAGAPVGKQSRSGAQREDDEGASP